MVEIKPQPTGNNLLPLVQENKLKVYAITSVHKKFPFSELKGCVITSLIAGYDDLLAMLVAQEGIKIIGGKPEEYHMGINVVARYVDEIIGATTPPAQVMPTFIFPKKESSIDELVAHTLYVFDEAKCTPKEHQMAQDIITRFKNEKGRKL